MEASPGRPLNRFKLQFNLRSLLLFVGIVAISITAHDRYRRWRWSKAISTKSYFVGALIDKSSGNPDFDGFVEEVRRTVARGSWAGNGGSGTIVVFQPNLSIVVTQCEDVHQQLSNVLTRSKRQGKAVKQSDSGSSLPE